MQLASSRVIQGKVNKGDEATRTCLSRTVSVFGMTSGLSAFGVCVFTRVRYRAIIDTAWHETHVRPDCLQTFPACRSLPGRS